jgi:hypothetical protein
VGHFLSRIGNEKTSRQNFVVWRAVKIWILRNEFVAQRVSNLTLQIKYPFRREQERLQMHKPRLAYANGLPPFEPGIDEKFGHETKSCDCGS